MTTGKFGIGGQGPAGADGAAGSNGIGDVGVVGQVLWLPADNPSPGDTVTLDGTVYEFDGDGEGGIPVTIGAELADTLATLAEQINEGVLNLSAVATGEAGLMSVFTSNSPGGAVWPGANPVVSASEVNDPWVTVNEGRAANRSQATGRVVFNVMTLSESFVVHLPFTPAFVDWRLYTSLGEQIADATLTVAPGAGEDPENSVSIDPTAGATPPSSGDVLIFTTYE